MLVAGHFSEEQGVFLWILHKGEEQMTQFKVVGEGGGSTRKNLIHPNVELCSQVWKWKVTLDFHATSHK